MQKLLAIGYVFLSLMALCQNGQTKLPLTVFKGVTDCFNPHKKHLSPTYGTATLDGNIISNLRFYGNFTPAFQMTKGGQERDYANDRSDEPLWKLVSILFPSTSGQLSADSTHPLNFGKHINTPKTIALLINYTDDIRTNTPVDEENILNKIMETISAESQSDLTQNEAIKLDRDKKIINGIIETVRTALEKHGNTVNDQRTLGIAKGDLLRDLTRKIKQLSSAKAREIFMDKIKSLYIYGTHLKPKYTPNNPRLRVNPQFFHVVAQEIIKASKQVNQILENTNKGNLVNFKKNTLSPLVKAIKESIATEQRFYPQYTTEHIILAFLSYKFSTREDIKGFLVHLKPELINQEAVAAFDPSAVLKEEDLAPIALKKNYTPDDVIALITSDIWSMPTPYRVGTPILSNANAQMYDRKADALMPETFADCVETSIRHLINCFLYEPFTRNFSFKGLEKYHKSASSTKSPLINLAVLFNFYKNQPVDLANDGSEKMRSEWNRVVGDLNGPNESHETSIRYRQGTNELDAGFINLMQIFKKILGVHIKAAPDPKVPLDMKKDWLREAFEEVFNALNPNENYSISLNMDKVSAESEELSGVVTITVDDQDGMVYSFDFQSNPNRHGQLENYQVSDRLKSQDYTDSLINHFVNRNGSENALWLLAKTPKLQEHLFQYLPTFYQWFNESLFDNMAKIRFLEKINTKYEEDNSFIIPPSLKNIIKNIINNFSLDDSDTINKAASPIINLLNHEDTKSIVYLCLKTTKFNNEYDELDKEALMLVAMALNLNNLSLTSLILNDNEIDDERAEDFAQALENNTTLTLLNLKGNEIEADGAKKLANALTKNTTLTSLDLSANEIKKAGANAFAKVLQVNSTLTSLNLANNSIKEDGIDNLAEALLTNSTLKSLDLGYNNINDKVNKLAEALTNNTTLTSLSLGNTKISREGIRKLAKALEKNRTLTTLNLQNNADYIDDKYGLKFTAALDPLVRNNTTITSLNLSDNLINAEGIKPFAEALKENTTLQSLNLSNNTLRKEGIEHISQALETNNTLTTINLSYNDIGDDGAKRLAQVLTKNTTLSFLNLSKNNIGLIGATSLTEALMINRTMTHLIMHENELRAAGVDELVKALEKNPALKMGLNATSIGPFKFDDLRGKFGERVQ